MSVFSRHDGDWSPFAYNIDQTAEGAYGSRQASRSLLASHLYCPLFSSRETLLVSRAVVTVRLLPATVLSPLIQLQSHQRTKGLLPIQSTSLGSSQSWSKGC